MGLDEKYLGVVHLLFCPGGNKPLLASHLSYETIGFIQFILIDLTSTNEPHDMNYVVHSVLVCKNIQAVTFTYRCHGIGAQNVSISRKFIKSE